MLRMMASLMMLVFSMSAGAATPDLLTTGPGFMGLLEFFGIGILLAFTPCVLPMVPILSGIILGQKDLSTSRAFQLSLTFVLSMAFTYALAGVLAGYLGHTIQGALQTPWVIVSFSAIFVVMALSMFGLFQLQMPRLIQNKIYQSSNTQKSGSLAGVAVMGVLSTLIASPCVTAPLVSVLTYISNTGNAITGGLTLFVLALGMGVPLLLFGMGQGRLLPKSGAWMNLVKSLFGIMMLGLAIWMMSRIVSDTVTRCLEAILFLGSTVGFALSAKNTEGKSRRIAQGISVLGLVATLFVAMQVWHAKSDVSPVTHLFTVVTTRQDLQQQLARAQAAGKPAMIDIYATWCTDCQALDKHYFADPKVQQLMQKFVAIRVDVSDEKSEEISKIKEQYQIYGTPTIFFIDKKGVVLANRYNEEIPLADLKKIADGELVK